MKYLIYTLLLLQIIAIILRFFVSFSLWIAFSPIILVILIAVISTFILYLLINKRGLNGFND